MTPNPQLGGCRSYILSESIWPISIWVWVCETHCQALGMDNETRFSQSIPHAVKEAQYRVLHHPGNQQAEGWSTELHTSAPSPPDPSPQGSVTLNTRCLSLTTWSPCKVSHPGPFYAQSSLFKKFLMAQVLNVSRPWGLPWSFLTHIFPSGKQISSVDYVLRSQHSHTSVTWATSLDISVSQFYH